MKIEIKSWLNSRILFESEFGSLKLAVEAAVKARANLAGANLAVADLAGAYLARAALAGASLAGADLAGADLAGANLAGADLAGADLAVANLAGADLAGAYLARADLAGANLAGADLAGADLAGAYLARADLARANLGNGQKATTQPVFLIANGYTAMITDRHIKIGCAVKTTEGWAELDADAIKREFTPHLGCLWDMWREPLLAVARAHQGRVES